MALETQIMQLTWRRRRATGTPGPLQYKIYLNKPRMLQPHLTMSPHKRKMIDDRTFFIFQFLDTVFNFSFSLVYLLIEQILQFLKHFTFIYAVSCLVEILCL